MQKNKLPLYIGLTILGIFLEFAGIIVSLANAFSSNHAPEWVLLTTFYVLPFCSAVVVVKNSNKIILTVLNSLVILFALFVIGTSIQQNINDRKSTAVMNQALSEHVKTCQSLLETFKKPQIIADIIRVKYTSEIAVVIQDQRKDITILPKSSQSKFLEKLPDYDNLNGKFDPDFEIFFAPILKKLHSEYIGKSVQIDVSPCQEFGPGSQTNYAFEGNVYLDNKILFSD